jgi:hypothetical protein
MSHDIFSFLKGNGLDIHEDVSHKDSSKGIHLRKEPIQTKDPSQLKDGQDLINLLHHYPSEFYTLKSGNQTGFQIQIDHAPDGYWFIFYGNYSSNTNNAPITEHFTMEVSKQGKTGVIYRKSSSEIINPLKLTSENVNRIFEVLNMKVGNSLEYHRLKDVEQLNSLIFSENSINKKDSKQTKIKKV